MFENLKNSIDAQLEKGKMVLICQIVPKEKFRNDYSVGNFSWKWDTRCIDAFRQIIIGEATGRKFLSDGTSYEE